MPSCASTWAVFGKRDWSRDRSQALSFYSIGLDIQLLLGLLLYFVVSPLMASIRADFGAAMSDSNLRFFAVEHISLMMLAVVLGHVAVVMARRADTSPVQVPSRRHLADTVRAGSPGRHPVAAAAAAHLADADPVLWVTKLELQASDVRRRRLCSGRISMADTADSRAAILEAAKLLFMQEGFRGISMRQIAEAVGVTKAALYYHFKDKEELFVAIVERYLVAMSILIDEVTRQRSGHAHPNRGIGPPHPDTAARTAIDHPAGQPGTEQHQPREQGALSGDVPRPLCQPYHCSPRRQAWNAANCAP